MRIISALIVCSLLGCGSPSTREARPKDGDGGSSGGGAARDRTVEQARAALRAAGVREPARLRGAPGPGWMYDPAATAPLVVVTLLGDPGEPGQPEEHYVVAVDPRDGRAYHHDPRGFEVLMRALGVPGKADRLTAEQILAAWLVLAAGEEPTVTRPSLGQEPDGALVVSGWTGDRGPQRRIDLRIAADGGVQTLPDVDRSCKVDADCTLSCGYPLACCDQRCGPCQQAYTQAELEQLRQWRGASCKAVPECKYPDCAPPNYDTVARCRAGACVVDRVPRQ
ncbi:MAG TPA: hypothetical protein VL172_01525 [Kofleriaceae bacterium]|nr:hypothetical protein [Kofleriaceae bacterium]